MQPGQDRLQVLREWVLSGENADKSESAIVLQRCSLQRNDANEECLTLQQMFERKIPIEKIRAVVAKGGGIPDKDAPNVAKLTAYWIETSRTRLNREDGCFDLGFSRTGQCWASISCAFGHRELGISGSGGC